MFLFFHVQSYIKLFTVNVGLTLILPALRLAAVLPSAASPGPDRAAFLLRPGVKLHRRIVFYPKQEDKRET